MDPQKIKDRCRPKILAILASEFAHGRRYVSENFRIVAVTGVNRCVVKIGESEFFVRIIVNEDHLRGLELAGWYCADDKVSFRMKEIAATRVRT